MGWYRQGLRGQEWDLYHIRLGKCTRERMQPPLRVCRGSTISIAHQDPMRAREFVDD